MNCKPGDLAVVVDSMVKQNIGLFVEVVEPFVHGRWPFHTLDQSPAWVCRAKGKIIYVSAINGEQLITSEGPIPDKCLRPIRPQPMGDNTETKRNLEVTA